MKQFIPYQGVYVIARQLGDHGVIVMLNGTTEKQTVNTLRYSELYKGNARQSDYEIMREEQLNSERRAFVSEMKRYNKSKDGKTPDEDAIYSVYHPRLSKPLT